MMEPTTSSAHDLTWVKLRSVNSLPKCKNLVKRACLNSLPVCANISHREGKVDPTCPRCGCKPETVEHALLTCQESIKVWFGSHLCIRGDVGKSISFIEWLRPFLQHADEVALSEMFNIVWAIWFSRNQLVFKGRVMDFEQIIAKAHSQPQPEPRPHPHPHPQPVLSGPITWRRPRFDSVKINFHASINKRKGTGMGFVARNHEGAVLAAATCYVKTIYKPKIAEALCYRWAICVGREFCFVGAVYETECVQLLNCWNSAFPFGGSFFEAIVADCKRLSKDRGVKMQGLLLTKREGNKVAHELANLAFTLGERYWVDQLPRNLDMLVTADVTLSALPLQLQ